MWKKCGQGPLKTHVPAPLALSRRGIMGDGTRGSMEKANVPASANGPVESPTGLALYAIYLYRAMPITFAVKMVQLKVYTTIVSPMTFTFFIQGHKCVSNFASFYLAISRTIFKAVTLA